MGILISEELAVITAAVYYSRSVKTLHRQIIVLQ